MSYSLFVYSIAPKALTKAKKADYFSSGLNDQASHRISFEHSIDKHLYFMSSYGVGGIGKDSNRQIDDYNIFSPKQAEKILAEWDNKDMDEFAAAAKRWLSSEHDPDELVYIVKQRLLPLLNHAKQHGEYVVTTFQ